MWQGTYMQSRSLLSATIFPPNQGIAFSFLGSTITCKSDPQVQSSRLYEFFGTASSGVPPLHTHAWDETFYFLSGEVDFLVADQIVQATPGVAITLPAGVAHSFRVKSAQAKFLIWVSNSAAVEYLEELTQASQTPSLSMQEVMEIAQKHQVRLV
jgi:mannose-6-phosphate isomerase-like protein (cupin superfamily)